MCPRPTQLSDLRLQDRSGWWPSLGRSHERGLAEGRAGGPDDAHTFILLANATGSEAEVTITYLRETGEPITRNHTVAPNSRFTVFVNGDVPALDNQRFGAVVEVMNDVPIAVERAMYGNAGGTVWAAGTNATAARLPPSFFAQ